MGRVSLNLHLEELPLKDANSFWGKKTVSSYEKFKVFSVTGGIPRYLEEIQPEQTAEQNLKRLCFTPGGVLVEEFDKIFQDIFGTRAPDFRKIVRLLVNANLELEGICEALGVEPSGGLSHKLTVLEQSGFLSRDYVWNRAKKTKVSRFRLSDNYIRFYLKYIEPKKDLIRQGTYEAFHLENLPDWNSMMGLQLENLVLNNRKAVIQLLDIPPSSLISVAPYLQKPTQRKRGC